MEELQRNLSQVTSEKVKALIELAQLKREYQLLQENSMHVLKHGNFLGDGSDRSINVHNREGKLRNLLKRTYLTQWIGKDLREHETDSHGSNDESSLTNKKNFYPVDFARLKVENAALHESMANMKHLTSSIYRLCITLLKAREDATSAGPMESITEALSSTIAEANHVKTALGSSLPVSWSADAAVEATTYENLYEPTDPSEATRGDRVDPASAAGLEMVELLILAAQLLKESIVGRSVD